MREHPESNVRVGPSAKAPGDQERLGETREKVRRLFRRGLEQFRQNALLRGFREQ
jgi:hypothetical protein